MVARCNDVRPGLEQFLGIFRRNAESTGRIFTVDDAQPRAMLVDEGAQPGHHHPAAHLSGYISDENDFQDKSTGPSPCGGSPESR